MPTGNIIKKIFKTIVKHPLKTISVVVAIISIAISLYSNLSYSIDKNIYQTTKNDVNSQKSTKDSTQINDSEKFIRTIIKKKFKKAMWMKKTEEDLAKGCS